MELATSGKYIEGRFIVQASGAAGGPDFLELSELGSRGLPTPGKTKRRVVTTDFAAWTESQVEQYVRAFEMGGSSNGHQVFEFYADGHRYLVPALAIMRALFRPHRYVLRAMFLAQGLERVCYPIISDGVLSVIPTEECRIDAREATRQSILMPLAWMYSFPSARRMCSSVHAQMLQGRIALELPLARAKMVLQVVEAHDTSYVTALTIVTVDALEPPYEFAANQLTRVVFHQSAESAVGNSPRAKLRDQSLSRNGHAGTDITDQEWSRIRSLLPGATRRREHDPRLLLDGILAKLDSGVAWRRASYKTGNWVNASSYLQNLKRQGAWSQVVDTLRNLRAAQPS